MRHAVSHRNGWTTIVKGDRGQNFNRNPMHGANTLIMNIPGVLAMGEGKGCYTHSVCGNCVRFADCQKSKNVAKDTDYCQFTISRFEVNK